MNVFILSTGRCGSATFIKACKYINNYSSEHESRVSLFGEERLAYEECHIESDNRLSWFLGRLDREFGDNAFYVHLTRDREATARSYAKRLDPKLLMNSYMHGIYMGIDDEQSPYDLALDMYDTINENIKVFLENKSNKMNMTLENIQEEYPVFWQRIGAQGSLDSALKEWNIQHNATKIDDYRPPHFMLRVINKLVRTVIKFPRFLRDV